MKTKLFKRILLIVIAIAVVASVAACSQREAPITDDQVNQGTGDGIISDIRNETPMTEAEAKEYLKEAIDNYKTLHTAPDDPEWYVMDVSLTYDYDYFWLDSS